MLNLFIKIKKLAKYIVYKMIEKVKKKITLSTKLATLIDQWEQDYLIMFIRNLVTII